MKITKKIDKSLVLAAVSGSVLCLLPMVSHSAQAANLLSNGSFENIGPIGPSTTFTGQTGAGFSAAANWTLFNNTFETTDTELLPSTLPGGGAQMIRVETTGFGNGLVQVFLPFNTGPSSVISSAWVYVISGKVGLGTGNGGNTGLNILSSTTGQWEFLDGRFEDFSALL